MPRIEHRALAFLSMLSLFIASPRAETMSLEQVLLAATKNTHDMEIIRLDHEVGKEEILFYRSSAFPQISFSSGVAYTSISNSASNSFDQFSQIVGDRYGGTAINWGLNLRQPLVTFGKVVSAIRIAKLRKINLKDSRQFAQDRYYLEVIQSFNHAFLAQKSVEIAEKKSASSRQLLERLQGDKQDGRIAERDFLRAQARFHMDEAELSAARARHEAAVSRLARLANLRQNEIVLRLDSTGAYVSDLQPAPSGSGLGLKMKALELKMRQAYITKERSALFPQISLLAGVHNDFMILDTTDMTVRYHSLFPPGTPASQIPDIEIPEFGDYYDQKNFNYNIGLQLSWNLFTGRRSTSMYRQAKLQAQKVEHELRKMEEENRIAVKEARKTVQVLEDQIRAAEYQLAAMEKASLQTQSDYRDGAVDIITLLDTEKELHAATHLLHQMTVQQVLAVAQLRILSGQPVYEE